MEGIDGEMFWIAFSLRVAFGVCLGVIGAAIVHGLASSLARGLERLWHEVRELFRR